MKPLPPELSAKIDEVKSWMMDGDQARVARKSGKYETQVSQVLNKKIAPNKKILEAAIDQMNKNKADFECNQNMKIA